MSKALSKPQGKSTHPLHSSFILNRSPNPTKATEALLSRFHTTAASQFDLSSAGEHEDLKQRYESRIRTLTLGYERTKEQYEESLKNMYKQKIILLNIISHNQTLVNEFRNRVDLQTGNFKEIEEKHHFIASGIMHGKLCSSCIAAVSSLNLQGEMEREQARASKVRNEARKKKMGAVKQYSWMYVPNPEKSETVSLKREIQRLKAKMEDIAVDHSKKMAQREAQIKQLKHDLVISSAPTHRIVICDEKREESLKIQLKQLKAKQLDLQGKLLASTTLKQKYECLLKDSNETLLSSHLTKLNAKYRSKFL